MAPINCLEKYGDIGFDRYRVCGAQEAKYAVKI